MNKLIFFLLCLFTFSCSADAHLQRAGRKLDRLIAHHPGLAKSDTVVVSDQDTIPAITGTTYFIIDTLFIGLDSVITPAFAPEDSSKAQTLVREIRTFLQTRPLLSDTVYKWAGDSILVKAYATGVSGEIGIDLWRPSRITEEIHAQTTTTISASNIRSKSGFGLFKGIALTLLFVILFPFFTKNYRN